VPASAVVLAAGEGTRMRSPLPKVLHIVAGRPMLDHVLTAVAALVPPPDPVVIVVGRQADEVRATAAARAGELGLEVAFATQGERRGTGHAVQQAAPAAAGRAPTVLVVYGDVPLVTPDTLRRLLIVHRDACDGAVTMVTTLIDDPSGYGRVVRRDDRAGDVARIVEDRVATDAEREIREINAGLYAFDDAWLWPALDRLTPSAGGEIYLTDLVDRAVAGGRRVVAVTADPLEVAGVNTPAELARADAALRARADRGHAPLQRGHEVGAP
jgi:bifunctional UDP-N-acetylglucosamine pyrophosphorylase / glucosamine-1-phosphate N-acetyltransferase